MTFRTRTFATLASLALLSACGTLDPGGAKPTMDAAARLHVAAAAEASGDTDIALAMYAAVAAGAPGNADAQARYAVALTDAGRPRQAAEILGRALVRDSGNATLLRQSARLELLAGHLDVALRRYDQALAVAPDDEAARIGRGVALDMQGRHDDAQAEYRRVLAVAPDNAAAANNMALSMMFEGHYDTARDTLERFAEAPGAPERLRASLAFARAGSGDTRAATQLFGPGLTGEQLAGIAAALHGT